MKKYLSLIALLGFISGCNCARKECPTENSSETRKDTTVKKTKLPSGLEYVVTQESDKADAAYPKRGQKVTAHYTGWLAGPDGEPNMSKKFDSSVDRGTPFSFTVGVGQVIQAWDEGLMLMKVGEKRRLYVPAELGYGARGAGGVIPPNANLVFDVELVDVN